MVADPWIHKMRSAATAATTASKSKKKKKKEDPAAAAQDGRSSSSTIGILSFEFAAAMSRAVHLHRSISDAEVARLRSDALESHAVRSLVSPEEPYLLALAMAEKLDDLNRVAGAAARLGRRCQHPTLVGFEHVYADLLAGRIPDPAALGFLSKDINSAVRQMERLITSTAGLYTELEVLTELEQSAKKFPPTEETRRALDQKIQWQRHDVKLLRDASLWNQTYDKVVLLLARAVCTIHARIRHVFGEAILELDCLIPKESQQLSGPIFAPRRHLPLHSGPFGTDTSDGKSGPIRPVVECKSGPIRPVVELEAEFGRNFRREGLRFHCGASHGRLFMDCLSLGGSALTKDSDDRFENESYLSRSGTGALIPFSGKIGTSRFGPKSRLMMLAPPSTLGGSSLALHYANIVIIIEKLLRYPHMVGEEVRDDLYQMLPSSLRAALRKSLRSYVKNLAIYDAPLAHDWKEVVDKILSWLGPMAHNMIRWQTERNFEQQQQIVLRANVLLLETLYFADRQKTEAAICELLVGLSYICRYEQQQHALLDCTSSMDFDDRMDWQMQY